MGVRARESNREQERARARERRGISALSYTHSLLGQARREREKEEREMRKRRKKREIWPKWARVKDVCVT